VLVDSTLHVGTQSNEDGEFELENLQLGRHILSISSIGYETIILNDVLVSSTGNPELIVQLKVSTITLGKAVIRLKQEKEHPLNSVATISAK